MFKKIKWLCGAVLVFSLVLIFVPVMAGPVIIEYSTGITAGAEPHNITAGPDGNLWFTEVNGNQIGKITPDGLVKEYSAGITAKASLHGITVGPDGNIWFAETGTGKIGMITPAGVVTEYSKGITADSQPHGITSGPDGNLWFVEFSGNQIGKITTAGVVTEYSTGISADAQLHNITTGPDGNLWFAEAGTDKVGMITLAGVVTEYSAGITTGAQPWDIKAGPDGNLWFTESGTAKIGKITPGGVVSEYPCLTVGTTLRGITVGPDGNLWFAELSGNRIGKITPAGVVSEYSSGITTGASPFFITSGPDGNLWFTEQDGNRIGKLTGFMPPYPTISGTPTTTASVGTAYSFTPTSANATSFNITGTVPPGFNFNTITGNLSGTPMAVGTYTNIVITATNATGSAPFPAFSITVTPPLPTISGTPSTSVTNGTVYSFTPTSAYATSFFITNKPIWADFDTAAGTLSGTPRYMYPAVVGFSPEPTIISNIVISATNSLGTVSLPAFNITVYPVADVATLPTCTVGIPYTYYLDSPNVTANIPGLTYNPLNHTLSGIPTSYGSFPIQAELGGAVSTFTLTCSPNQAPSISGSPVVSTIAGNYYSFTPVGSDVNGNPLTYSVANKPSWASFDTSTGALTGTAVAGTYSNIQISVSDGSLTAALPVFFITVAPLGGSDDGTGGSGGSTPVPVMEGWWLLPGMLAGVGMFARRRKG